STHAMPAQDGCCRLAPLAPHLVQRQPFPTWAVPPLQIDLPAPLLSSKAARSPADQLKVLGFHCVALLCRTAANRSRAASKVAHSIPSCSCAISLGPMRRKTASSASAWSRSSSTVIFMAYPRHYRRRRTLRLFSPIRTGLRIHSRRREPCWSAI